MQSTQNGGHPQVDLENYGQPVDASTASLIKKEISELFSRHKSIVDKILSNPHSPDSQALEAKGIDKQTLKKANDVLANFKASEKFPGAQPISFQSNHIFTLQNSEFLVCEKSDGQRYFLVETINPS
jgi:hypothetical protein